MKDQRLDLYRPQGDDFLWEVMESNHPSPKATDLQSVPLPLRYNFPFRRFSTGFEPFLSLNANVLPLHHHTRITTSSIVGKQLKSVEGFKTLLRCCRIYSRSSVPFCSPNGIRTRVSTLKGWCPKPSRRWDHITKNPI